MGTSIIGLGDGQFRALPDVEVVPTDLESVKGRLDLADWPNNIGQIDLGDRVIECNPDSGTLFSHMLPITIGRPDFSSQVISSYRGDF